MLLRKLFVFLPKTKTVKIKMDELKLTKSQKKVFKAYKQGKNIFMTGKGGTGKSFITKYIIDDARQ